MWLNIFRCKNWNFENPNKEKTKPRRENSLIFITFAGLNAETEKSSKKDWWVTFRLLMFIRRRWKRAMNYTWRTESQRHFLKSQTTKLQFQLFFQTKQMIWFLGFCWICKILLIFLIWFCRGKKITWRRRPSRFIGPGRVVGIWLLYDVAQYYWTVVYLYIIASVNSW